MRGRARAVRARRFQVDTWNRRHAVSRRETTTSTSSIEYYEVVPSILKIVGTTVRRCKALNESFIAVQYSSTSTSTLYLSTLLSLYSVGYSTRIVLLADDDLGSLFTEQFQRA